MMQEAKMGHSIGLFPEGNITIDGSPLPIDRSVAKLAKQLKMQVVLYRIERGYLKKPKWALYARKGRVWGSVSRVISQEEVAEMSVDDLLRCIRQGINYDAMAEQKRDPVPYSSRKAAAGIERLLYVCPNCLSKGKMHSAGEWFGCDSCGKQYRLNDLGELVDAPFDNVSEWNRWQTEIMHAMDVLDAPTIEGKWSEIGQRKNAESARLSLAEDGVHIGGKVYGYGDINGIVLHDCNHILMTVDGVAYRYEPEDKMANVLPLIVMIKDRLAKR
jgi:1-acyl-sn-glycerol-3-phosphate acyltransferase